MLPNEDLLRSGIAALEARVAPADERVMKVIVVKLADTFPQYGAISERQETNRTSVWMTANGDLPNDLWVEAATACAKHPFKRMPSPGEFREFVKAAFDQRWRELKRARQLLEIVEGKAKASYKPKPPAEPETVEFRLRSMRDSYRRHGRLASSASAERELAEIEGREPAFVEGEKAAVEQVEPPAQAKSPQPATVIPTSPGMKVALLRARARFWRAQGRTEMAAAIEAEADAISPLPPQERTDIPEARQ